MEILQNPDVDAIFRSWQCSAASIQHHSSPHTGCLNSVDDCARVIGLLWYVRTKEASLTPSFIRLIYFLKSTLIPKNLESEIEVSHLTEPCN